MPNPRQLSNAAYLALARVAALRGARRNGVPASGVDVCFPGGGFAPTRIAVVVRGRTAIPLGNHRRRRLRPDGRRGAARGWSGAAGHVRLPLRRRAGKLFAAHPDPKWVAPPGQSLHRYGTELDLGPPAAYGWLAANAGRFGVKRYSWEDWH